MEEKLITYIIRPDFDHPYPRVGHKIRIDGEVYGCIHYVGSEEFLDNPVLMNALDRSALQTLRRYAEDSKKAQLPLPTCELTASARAELEAWIR